MMAGFWRYFNTVAEKPRASCYWHQWRKRLDNFSTESTLCIYTENHDNCYEETWKLQMITNSTEQESIGKGKDPKPGKVYCLLWF